jgi:hypothetical protein
MVRTDCAKDTQASLADSSGWQTPTMHRPRVYGSENRVYGSENKVRPGVARHLLLDQGTGVRNRLAAIVEQRDMTSHDVLTAVLN